MLAARLTRRRASLHLACAALLGLALSRPIGETDISRDYWMMAQAFRKQGEPAQAADYYGRAIRVSPADPLLHNGLGGALEQLGQVDRAEAEYRRAIELRPALSLPHRNLGLILMRHGPASGEEAYQNLMIAERSGRGDLEVAKAMAALLLARGDAPGARARALEVLRVEPRDPAAQAVLRATGGPGP